MTDVPTLPSSQTEASPLAIAVRAYVPPPPAKEGPPKPKRRRSTPVSPWTLVFDTETTADAAQQLRYGAYQLRHNDDLIEVGVFYDPQSLTPEEIALLQRMCAERQLRLREASDFIENVFYAQAYDFRGSFVGFNLPFDISRLAIKHGPARGKKMRGGFSFALSPFYWRPRVQVRHLNARAALTQFAHPPKRRDNRRSRKTKTPAKSRRGSFIDLKTIAAALTSRSHSLASLARLLETPAQKLEMEEFGGPLRPKDIDYVLQDVEVTWQCYQALRSRYDLHGLADTPINKILSEASLGKAYFQQMGIRPLRELQPDFPDRLTGIAMSAYYGGRSEIRWRREIKQVLYCDFLSMYPTVCTLMGLWKFFIAQGVEWRDATAWIRELVKTITLDQLQRRETWALLPVFVRVRPARDVFPVRAKYDNRSHTIGLNFLSGEHQWFTLADVIASKLLTGKTPEILEAIAFSPKEPQEGLRAVSIAGNPEYRIDPRKDDFFRKLIDLRGAIKTMLENARGAERDRLEADQLTLKIIASATSYGITAEVNVSDLEDFARRTAYGARGEPFEVETNKNEEPGIYFHPMLAAFITGAARLNLAIAERLTVEKGLDWAFCDTDSMAIAKPPEMDDAEFLARAKSICDWFEPLNPYEQKGQLFKVENANFESLPGGKLGEYKPLFCLCISAKRYVLFNIGSTREVIIRKASAHGLGHLRPPYDEVNAPACIPAPVIPLKDVGVERWQYDLWHQTICAVLEGHPDQVPLDYHPALGQPAASRYAATTPTLSRWFKTYNQNRPYRDQVRPFGFLIGFHVSPIVGLPDDEPSQVGKRGRPRKIAAPRPIAPFDKKPSKAALNAFDRETGARVRPDQLLSYAEALAQYHLSPESKFLNGDFLDRGRTERRHVIASQVTHVGKESNRWEEQYFTGYDEDAEVEYGEDSKLDERLDQRLRKICDEFGQRETAKRLGISRGTLFAALRSGVGSLSRSVVGSLSRSLYSVHSPETSDALG